MTHEQHNDEHGEELEIKSYPAATSWLLPPCHNPFYHRYICRLQGTYGGTRPSRVAMLGPGSRRVPQHDKRRLRAILNSCACYPSPRNNFQVVLNLMPRPIWRPNARMPLKSSRRRQAIKSYGGRESMYISLVQYNPILARH